MIRALLFVEILEESTHKLKGLDQARHCDSTTWMRDVGRALGSLGIGGNDTHSP
jgi:hypothetical protein